MQSRNGARVAQMVGRSFRYGILARREMSAAGWSYAWQEMAGLAGPDEADRLLSVLGQFVDCVESSAARRIEVLPKACPGLCRDECLAVSVVAASQTGACPALKACVFALIESANVEPCIRSAGTFSNALRDAGHTLPPDFICNALALMPTGQHWMRCDA
jgi:hypothetical protein